MVAVTLLLIETAQYNPAYTIPIIIFCIVQIYTEIQYLVANKTHDLNEFYTNPFTSFDILDKNIKKDGVSSMYIGKIKDMQKTPYWEMIYPQTSYAHSLYKAFSLFKFIPNPFSPLMHKLVNNIPVLGIQNKSGKYQFAEIGHSSALIYKVSEIIRLSSDKIDVYGDLGLLDKGRAAFTIKQKIYLYIIIVISVLFLVFLFLFLDTHVFKNTDILVPFINSFRPL